MEKAKKRESDTEKTMKRNVQLLGETVKMKTIRGSIIHESFILRKIEKLMVRNDLVRWGWRLTKDEKV